MAKEQFSFGHMMDASLLFKVFIIFPNQDTISSLLEPYKGKGFVSVRKVILWNQRAPCNVSSRTCRQCVYVDKFRSYSWLIAVILSFRSSGYATIGDYGGFTLGCSVVPQRDIRARRAIR